MIKVNEQNKTKNKNLISHSFAVEQKMSKKIKLINSVNYGDKIQYNFNNLKLIDQQQNNDVEEQQCNEGIINSNIEKYH